MTRPCNTKECPKEGAVDNSHYDKVKDVIMQTRQFSGRFQRTERCILVEGDLDLV